MLIEYIAYGTSNKTYYAVYELDILWTLLFIGLSAFFHVYLDDSKKFSLFALQKRYLPRSFFKGNYGEIVRTCASQYPVPYLAPALLVGNLAIPPSASISAR